MPKVKTAAIASCLIAIFIWQSAVQTAQGSDYFKTGCDLYSRGEYQRAVRCFNSIIRQNKNYWPAYYQLANTYLALKEHDLAKKYYDLCIEKMPDFKTAKACKLAIDHIDKLTRAKEGLSDDDNSENEIEDPALVEAQKRKDLMKEEAKTKYESEVAQAEKRKSDILSDAMRRANAIREEARRRIQQIHDEGNYWVRNPSTNEIGLGIPESVHDSITGEAEEKAKKIVDEAEQRAKGIQLPREPDWESFKVHPSSVSRKKQSNHK